MARGPFLNAKRLRDYPRLFLISSWAIILLNILLRDGWIGGLTGIMMFGDFISYYAGGVLFRMDIAHLYDPMVQTEIQLGLVAPSQPPGFAPFISTPYVAMAYGALTGLPLPWALGLWAAFSVICAGGAVVLLQRFLIPEWLKKAGLSPGQMGMILASCFALVIGFQAGQNHTLTLLLVSAIVLATQREKWLLAGVLAGLLAYKPQFALGFLIIWLIWRQWKALLGFGLVAGAWAGLSLLIHGIEPYRHYLAFSELLLMLPYAKDSFPIAIMATPYALLATLIPPRFAPALQAAFSGLGVALALGLGIVAWRHRRLPVAQRNAALALAIFFPLLIMPHTLVYDLLILIPALFLLAEDAERGRRLLLPAALAYAGTLFLPLVGFALRLALTGLIPTLLFLSQVRRLWKRPESETEVSVP
ncbi:MAG: DUF2029 domain-containing protein [Anaerolineales bacterium]|nr:DUF2029 domain-containing protein [Anaerolineales bacterium]